jgi:gamma-glutamylcyclotransferase (GGCT)/AIG2-like uncharacterized protein YtfP
VRPTMSSSHPVPAPDGAVPVFVYGTLRPGGRRWEASLAPHVVARRPAHLPGADLYEGPGYPVMVHPPAPTPAADRGPDGLANGGRFGVGDEDPARDGEDGTRGVVGVVVWLSPGDEDEVIASLDEIEGHVPGGDDNQYERVRREVTTPHGPVSAWTYVAGPRIDVRSLPILRSGDWLAR